MIRAHLVFSRTKMLLMAGLVTACGGAAPAADAPTPAAGETPAASEPEVADAPDTDVAEAADANASSPDAAPSGEEGTGSPKAPLSDGETRTMEVIQKIVLDNRQVFRTCYDAVQAKVPELKGDMTLHFVLSAEGRVLSAKLNEERSTIKNDELTQCAISELRKLQFPASSKGLDTKVNYPFNFNPR